MIDQQQPQLKEIQWMNFDSQLSDRRWFCLQARVTLNQLPHSWSAEEPFLLTSSPWSASSAAPPQLFSSNNNDYDDDDDDDYSPTSCWRIIATMPFNPTGILNQVPAQHCIKVQLFFFTVVWGILWSCLIHHHLPPVASSATIPSSILLPLRYLLDCVSSSHALSPHLAATSHGVIRIDIYSTDRPTTTSSSWNPLHRVKANHSKYVYGDHTHASSQNNVKQLAACGAYWRHRGECVEKSKYSTECGFVWMSVWRIFFAIIRPQVAANTYKWRRTILISKTHTGLHFTTRHEGYRI